MVCSICGREMEIHSATGGWEEPLEYAFRCSSCGTMEYDNDFYGRYVIEGATCSLEGRENDGKTTI